MEKISYRWDSIRGRLGDKRQRSSIGPVVTMVTAKAQKDKEAEQAGEALCWFGIYESGCTCGMYETEQEALNWAHAANVADGCVESFDLAQLRANKMAELRRAGMAKGDAYEIAKQEQLPEEADN